MRRIIVFVIVGVLGALTMSWVYGCRVNVTDNRGNPTPSPTPEVEIEVDPEPTPSPTPTTTPAPESNDMKASAVQLPTYISQTCTLEGWHCDSAGVHV